MGTRRPLLLALAVAVMCPLAALAGSPSSAPAVGGIRVEFILFGLTLAGVAVFHRRTFEVAMTGLVVITTYRLWATHFDMLAHLHAEWPLLLNLFGLLMGFAILARHFEEARIPHLLPRWLPPGWLGGFVLLAAVFVMATFIDNIAAAMIGGTFAAAVFHRRVRVGYLAAIAGAANAGGAFSVLGNTTTTMMWIDGVGALDILRSFIGSAVCLLTLGVCAAIQQHRHQPIVHGMDAELRLDAGRAVIVVLIPLLAVVANLTTGFPALGVWVAILIGTTFRSTPWHELARSFKGSLFLLALVFCASLMPVSELPVATWRSTFLIGVVSAVFDNIPLTKLALDQGGYDWALVAYAIGCGGSMIWFGSSAGVALCNRFPEARNALRWMREGWHVAAGYVLGFFVMLWLLGWHPVPPHKHSAAAPVPVLQPADTTGTRSPAAPSGR
jgi:Na+/H+ antiporter NhaD/arsenite permease-like protein